jgi:glucokinase
MSPDAVYGEAKGPLVLVGGNKGGAELGHTIVAYMGPDCNAGEYGSVESFAQRDAIVRRARLRISRGRETVIPDLVEGDLSKITPQTISQAAEKGDEVAIEIWEEVGTMLGVGVGNFINVFAPDVVAIGGQIAKAGDYLIKPCIKAARNVAIPSLFQDAKIQMAEQIADGGMLGAAALALESLKWTKT